MENKEQLNQNPEEVKAPVQEENSAVSNETEQVSKEEPNVKADAAEDDKQDEKVELVEEEKQEVAVNVEKTETVDEVKEATKEADAADKVDEKDTPVETEKVEAVEVIEEKVETEASKEEPSATEEGDEDHDDDEDDEEEEEPVTEETYAKHSLEELVLEFEELVESEKIVKAKNKVSFIRLFFGRKITEIKKEAEEKFISEGGVKEEYKPEFIPLEDKFNKAFGRYKSLRRKYRQEQEKQKIENLKKKNELLEEMRALIGSNEKLKDNYDKFNEIQNQWREAGMVPQADMQLLWNNYHFLVEKFFDKVKINKELRDLDLKKNLEAKIDLCEKAESLLIADSVNKSFKQLQEYHNEWKAVGPVPTSHNDEVWERFKVASDKINDRRKEHYDELQGKLEENHEAKKALCAKAEELFLKPAETTKEWGKRTDEFNELFKVWKTFGPAPRKYNDEVWGVFKGFMNGFFDAKKEHFNKLKDGQQENYHKKLDLLKQAEVLKDSTDWGAATKTLINLQKEWKNVGPVPRKHSDDIWKKFRAANDFFFDTKAKHFKGQIEAEETNLATKKALVEEIQSAVPSSNKKENLDLIKAFQRRWSEIGNVPRKAMDKIYKEYRAAVDEQLDKLDISKVDFRNAGFRDHIDGLKKNDDNSSLSKERFNIQKAIEKMKEEVLLWENNMGFFRHSKNADVLKQEFEKKIQKAKADIILLKEKIKMIDK